ncbi:hypothetical protein [Microbaculum sp. FT89]|uniref:hypothetical protein n=1 Tax=Microbaculum sp. FT89 TaxID=3447298 RepID=UPI003F53744C
MIRSVSRLSAAVAVLFALAVPGAQAGENGFLKGFTGEWRGTGAVRTAGNAPQEKLVCRVDGTLRGDDQLELSGRCGGERFTGTFKVSLTYNPVKGYYSAVWQDSLGSKSPPLTGLRNGRRLVFKVRHNDFETDGRAVSTLVVDPENTRFRIVGRTMSEAGSDDFVSADLMFLAAK